MVAFGAGTERDAEGEGVEKHQSIDVRCPVMHRLASMAAVDLCNHTLWPITDHRH